MTRPSSTLTTTSYVGRFAPSPSGPLHMGSLVCALASFLDARKHAGRWLLRIEDIDPPREQPDADQRIIASLDAHGLQWDGAVCYQSKNSKKHLRTLETLRSRSLSYRCTCTRKRVAALGGAYDRHCLNKNHPDTADHAVRLNTAAARGATDLPKDLVFYDRLQNVQPVSVDDDFIIRRKDGLFAYQLAVVVDDIAQGITDIVRGVDLFDTTPNQILLTRLLGGNESRYAHIPVLVGEDGCKLSKQSHAAPIDDSRPGENLVSALNYLKQDPPQNLYESTTHDILDWAIDAWDIEKLKGLHCVALSDTTRKKHDAK